MRRSSRRWRPGRAASEEPAHAAWQLHAFGEGAHAFFRKLLRIGDGVVGSSDDEILEHFDIVWIDDFWCELDGEHLVGAIDGDLDDAAASGAFDWGFGELFLELCMLRCIFCICFIMFCIFAIIGPP